MPSVPLSQNAGVGRQALPGPRVGVRAPLEAFGGGAAIKAIDTGGLADVTRKIYLEERQKADDVAQVASGSQLAALHTKLLLNAKSQMGANAFTTPEDVSTDWQKGTEEIAKSLTNDVQRANFARMAAMNQTQLNGSVQAHVAQQRLVYTGQQLDSYIKNARDVGLATGTAEGVSLSIDNQKIALGKLLHNEGADPETIQHAMASAASDMHAAFIAQLVDKGDDILAEQYLTAHKSEIVGSQLGKVEQLTQEGSTLGQSRREASRIIASSGTFEDAKQQIDAIENPRVADATERRVRQHFADVANQANAERAAANDRAAQIVDKTHSTDAIPRTDWMMLSAPQKRALEADEKRLRNPGEGPGDPDKYLHLLNEAYFNPASFSKQNILTVPGLNQSQRTALMSQQRTVGSREVREDVAELQHDVTRAEADVRYYFRKLETAKKDGDDDAMAMWQ